MNNCPLAKRNQRRSSLARFIALCFITAMFAVGASAQISIGGIKIPLPKNPQPKNPQPKNPQPNNPPVTINSNGSRPVPNVNKTPTSTNNTRVETGPTREQVDAFRKDMEPYREGMEYLHYMGESKAENPSSCRNAKEIRQALTDAAAFHEIIKQKYPGIENPTFHFNELSTMPTYRVGDLRRYAENREQMAKHCVNLLLGAKLAEKIGSINDKIAGFDKGEWGAYVLAHNSFDKAARHAELMGQYKEHYALVGLTTPNDSVLAEYEVAHARLVALANENAGKWVFPPTFRDPMIEAKARGWLKDRDPKATVVKIGMLHGDWQVNHHRNGIPSGRYKRGYVMFRLPGAPNCLVTSFALEQNYVGGGRFNAEAVTSGMQHSLRMQNCK